MHLSFPAAWRIYIIGQIRFLWEQFCFYKCGFLSKFDVHRPLVEFVCPTYYFHHPFYDLFFVFTSR